MKIHTNTVAAVIDYIKKELHGLYPKHEVDSFIFLLFNEFMNYERKDLLLRKDERMSESMLLNFIFTVKKLKQQIPIQYILASTEFYGLKFKVNEHVLIPRPETEELVDWVIKSHSEEKKLKILDIGTGSGCIAIALKKHLSQADVFAVDISKEAVAVAEENAELNEVSVHFLKADILHPDQINWDAALNIIVSNPPYIREKERELMQRNVVDYEPQLALFVKDDDPLLFYRNIFKFAQRWLIPGGKIFVEISEFHGKEVKKLAADNNFSEIELRKDLSGKDRMLRCTKPVK